MSKAFVLRFAVGDRGGVLSALWRVWRDEGKDDIYIAPSGITSDGNIAGIAKISLHKSRVCTFGFTSQYKRVIGGSGDRSVISWERNEGPEGGFAAAGSILIAAKFLSRQATPYGKELCLMKPPEKNGSLVIDMIFTRVPTDQQALLPHQVELGRATLSNGEHFVVIAGYCDDFDGSLFTRSALPLDEKTVKMGRWKEPADVPADQLRGAVVAFDSRTKTLRIVDIGHNTQ
jgi:hypothetical protein